MTSNLQKPDLSKNTTGPFVLEGERIECLGPIRPVLTRTERAALFRLEARADAMEKLAEMNGGKLYGADEHYTSDLRALIELVRSCVGDLERDPSGPEQAQRSCLEHAMICAWNNVPPDKAPPEWATHTSHPSRKGWERVANAARAFLGLPVDGSTVRRVEQ